MIYLERIGKNDPRLRAMMRDHYSQPGGFVGRSLCYAVMYEGHCYGAIVGGSTPKHLIGRAAFTMIHGMELHLNEIVNNLFYHVNGPYPVRNFTVKVLREYRAQVQIDWFLKYGDRVRLHESLVELPRSGETYRRDGWLRIGLTKGFTCKRIGGVSTDSWGGKRVWDRKNLRPKHVFVRLPA